MGRGKRNAQYQFLANSIDDSYPYVIVGGDFNTLTARSIADLEQKFAQIGMERVSADVGYTVGYPYLPFTLDHIFTRGFIPLEAGKIEKAVASDHVPIWITLVPKDL